MKQRILIVEDHSDLRQLIRMTLDRGSYELYEADSGDTGYRMAKEISPDLVLLDVTLPGTLDGLQVCSRLKSDPRYAHIPVVMLSSRSQPSDVAAGERAGANAYLTKPFSPQRLLARVAELLAESPHTALH